MGYYVLLQYDKRLQSLWKRGPFDRKSISHLKIISGFCLLVMLATGPPVGCDHSFIAPLKHFALNNKETNRKNSDSRVSERAAREIYLKAFEMIVKNDNPWAIMSSYNMINGYRASESEDLLTRKKDSTRWRCHTMPEQMAWMCLSTIFMESNSLNCTGMNI